MGMSFRSGAPYAMSKHAVEAYSDGPGRGHYRIGVT